MTSPVYDHVQWYHRLAVQPIKLLNRFGLGPFGGGYSVSAVIEALICYQRQLPMDFELSKTEQFVLEKIRDLPGASFLLEYRNLNYEAQHEILARWQDKALGVIWIGGGVFSLDHPLLSARKKTDWHIWTDAHPRVISSAQEVFHDYHQQKQGLDLSTYEIFLPRDISQLNKMISFLVNHGAEHLVIQGYGMTYALTYKENEEWLKKLEYPPHLGLSVVFNALETVELPGKFVAALDNQKMLRYREEHVQALFGSIFPQSEIVWKKLPDPSKTQNSYTWLIEIPPQRG